MGVWKISNKENIGYQYDIRKYMHQVLNRILNELQKKEYTKYLSKAAEEIFCYYVEEKKTKNQTTKLVFYNWVAKF